ncbi:hypothetical protein MAPG_03530 [Magnaporthiopsis poae ATCC 64411]|uniref:Uncharacterized protein n=1 Tax=Magnaporthiopsis poae (strain ATCC 64411 / 73-15) TaxID=644358 RepID=A0A0C4DU93_MAGP6|nr:hypothetical protein MAPG_03530 [Magnaporthiopsis poae ATCC 64411]
MLPGSTFVTPIGFHILQARPFPPRTRAAARGLTAAQRAAPDIRCASYKRPTITPPEFPQSIRAGRREGSPSKGSGRAGERGKGDCPSTRGNGVTVPRLHGADSALQRPGRAPAARGRADIAERRAIVAGPAVAAKPALEPVAPLTSNALAAATPTDLEVDQVAPRTPERVSRLALTPVSFLPQSLL